MSQKATDIHQFQPTNTKLSVIPVTGFLGRVKTCEGEDCCGQRMQRAKLMETKTCIACDKTETAELYEVAYCPSCNHYRMARELI